jgi:hypothetical protein
MAWRGAKQVHTTLSAASPPIDPSRSAEFQTDF